VSVSESGKTHTKNVGVEFDIDIGVGFGGKPTDGLG
jgi:hypothetical protein